MNNVLLTGASGYIGREIVHQLSSTGVRMRLLVHRSRPEIPLNGNIELLHGAMQAFDWKTLDDDPPDTIIHVARISGTKILTRYWAGIQGYRANKRFLAWADSLDYHPHILYTSGSLVYGSRGNIPADEHADVRPISFQRSYMPAETPFFDSPGQPRNNVSIVRPSWVYGPDSWFRQFYYRIMERDGFVPQYGDGENYMSLISLQDCARLIIEVGRQPNGGSIYNLSYGSPMRQCEFCKTLSILSGKPVKEISYRWIRAKFGKAVAEALTFSLIVKSVHPLVSGFHSTFVNHKDGLRETLRSLENEPVRSQQQKSFHRRRST